MNIEDALIDANVIPHLIKEWNVASHKEETVASFSIDANNMLTLKGTPQYMEALRSKGIRSDASNTAQFVLHETPAEVVAIALGLPGQSPAFRHECKERWDGFFTGNSIVNLAIEGHQSQSGRIDSDFENPGNVKVLSSRLLKVHDDLSFIPTLPDALGGQKDLGGGLERKASLMLIGDRVVPGYAIVADMSVRNAGDRLAIMVAHQNQVSTMSGVKADKLIKMGILESGEAYALFTDAVKPSMPILGKEAYPGRNDTEILTVKKSMLLARSGLEFSPNTLGFTEGAGAAHTHLSCMKHFIEDIDGTLAPKASTFRDTAIVHAPMPRVPEHLSVETLMAMSANGQSAVEKSMSVMMAPSGQAPAASQVKAVTSSIMSVLNQARSVREEMEVAIRAHREIAMDSPSPHYVSEITQTLDR